MNRRFSPRALIQIRSRAGLTQAQLAIRADTSPANLSRWEAGISVPSLAHALDLADALGCHPDQFMTEVESAELS